MSAAAKMIISHIRSMNISKNSYAPESDIRKLDSQIIASTLGHVISSPLKKKNIGSKSQVRDCSYNLRNNSRFRSMVNCQSSGKLSSKIVRVLQIFRRELKFHGIFLILFLNKFNSKTLIYRKNSEL